MQRIGGPFAGCEGITAAKTHTLPIRESHADGPQSSAALRVEARATKTRNAAKNAHGDAVERAAIRQRERGKPGKAEGDR
jgi:hypothetical protein